MPIPATDTGQIYEYEQFFSGDQKDSRGHLENLRVNE